MFKQWITLVFIVCSAKNGAIWNGNLIAIVAAVSCAVENCG
jgi:hypothetical protein